MRATADREGASRGLLQAQLLATLQALPVEPGFAPVSAVELTVKQVKLDIPPGPLPALWSPPAVVEAPPTAGRRDDPGAMGGGFPLCVTSKGQIGQTNYAGRAASPGRTWLR